MILYSEVIHMGFGEEEYYRRSGPARETRKKMANGTRPLPHNSITGTLLVLLGPIPLGH